MYRTFRISKEQSLSRIVRYYNNTMLASRTFTVPVVSNYSVFIDVVIGRSTEELCSCIVGMSRETDIELLNQSDRWVICSLSINQIQGDGQNVRLVLPKDVILIKPNAEQHPKVTMQLVFLLENSSPRNFVIAYFMLVEKLESRKSRTYKHIYNL